MNIKIVSAVILFGLGVAPALSAQDDADDSSDVKTTQVSSSVSSKYTPPNCGLKSGHFKVGSAATYLKTGIEADIPENRTRALSSGKKVVMEAIQQNNQGKNPAAWYYLGRIDLQQGDLVGADTSLTKAEALAPACKEDISGVRYAGWVPLVNAGIGLTKAEKNDSALAVFRQANTIYRDKPQAYSAAGVIFANEKATDSAIVYLQKAADIAIRVNMPEERNQATYNLAAMLQRANRNDEAIAALERFLGWVPKDVEAKKALATLYRTTGKIDKAQALEKEVGVSAPSAAAGPATPMSTAVALYNEKKYDQAAAAFEQVIAVEPYNRDALFGLANAYIGLRKGPKLAETSARLAAIEPLNEEVLRMLATGQRMSKKETLANKTALQALSLPLGVKVTQFAPTTDGASINATATGRDIQTPQGKPIAPKPTTLVFEFLDSKGTVVTNQEVQVPALKPAQALPIEAKGQGAGIAAWRYKQK